MPSLVQPAKLQLRKKTSGKRYWYIYHKGKRHATGCAEGETGEAETALRGFLDEQALIKQRETGIVDPTLGDALAKYAEDKIDDVSRPTEFYSRVERLLDFFGDFMVSGGATGERCREFSKDRGQVGARRDLEVLQASMNHWFKEAGQDKSFAIWKPANPRAREEWMTREDAAKMLHTILTAREVQGGSETKKYRFRHLARFFLIGLYTGSRSGVILNLRWEPSDTHGWIDLEAGIMYREGKRQKRTNKRKPPVKLSAKLLSHLRRWKRMDGLTDGFIVQYRGERVESVRSAWKGARLHCGITDRFTPHTLRHTRATWLMRAGVDLWDAAGSLGMTVQQLENGYGHHHPDMQKGSASV